MNPNPRRRFYIILDDWTWWAWTITAVLLLVGLGFDTRAFVGAMGVTVVQAIVLIIHDRGGRTFPVQLRAAYLALLLICALPGMRWLYWLPTVGTFALVIFGYCLLARVLSLLPWNSREPYTWERLRRTFFSTPDLARVTTASAARSCAGGLCSIDAQVPRPRKATLEDLQKPA